MVIQRKKFLIEKIDLALKDSQAHVDRAGVLFYAYRNASRSEEGDRAHVENAFDLAKSIHKKLSDFKKEVLALNDQPAQTIKPICYVILNDKEFYFVKESLRIPETTIIGAGSLLGQAILNKKAGDKYSYLTFSGEIKLVE